MQSVTVFCALFFKRVSFRFFFPLLSRVKAREQVVTTTHRVLIDSSQKKKQQKKTHKQKNESQNYHVGVLFCSILVRYTVVNRAETSLVVVNTLFFSRAHLTLSFCQKIIIIASKSLFSSKKLLFTSKSREKREEALVEAQCFSS